MKNNALLLAEAKAATSDTTRRAIADGADLAAHDATAGAIDEETYEGVETACFRVISAVTGLATDAVTASEVSAAIRTAIHKGTSK